MNGPALFQLVGTTPHRHEQEGLDWLRAALPTYPPFGGWALFSFQTDDGRRYEVDAVVMTAHAVFVVEAKAWRGDVIEGDVRHLVTWSEARGREVVDHPLPLLEIKTKALADRVRRVARRIGPDVADRLGGLWFEPLVWLTHADRIKLGDHDAARSHVIGRQELGDALRQARFAGAREDLRQRSCSPETLKALRKVLERPEFGLKAIDKPLTVLDGRFDLTRLIDEGDDYQDHLGRAARRRAGVSRPVLPRAPERPRLRAEARPARRARGQDPAPPRRSPEHPGPRAVRSQGPARPGAGVPRLPGQDAGRLSQGAPRQRRAIRPDHRRQARHPPPRRRRPGVLPPRRRRPRRALAGGRPRPIVRKPQAPSKSSSPASRSPPRGSRRATAPASSPGSPAPWRAPTKRPRSRAARRPPRRATSSRWARSRTTSSPRSRPRRAARSSRSGFGRDEGLVISAVRDDLFPPGDSRQNLDLVLRSATAPEPTARTQELGTLLDFVDLLEEALTTPEEAPSPPPSPPAAEPAPEIDPLAAVKDTVLGGDLVVLGELGSGATARVFKVRHPVEGEVALKVPLSDAHDERIAREGEVLERLRRTPGVDRIAHFVGVRPIAGRTCLLVQLAGDRTLADEVRAQGALSLDYARRWGDDLLTALRSLEEAGVQHRDIKPANIGLTSGMEKGKKRLLLFDFSLSQRPATDSRHRHPRVQGSGARRPRPLGRRGGPLGGGDHAPRDVHRRPAGAAPRRPARIDGRAPRPRPLRRRRARRAPALLRPGLPRRLPRALLDGGRHAGRLHRGAAQRPRGRGRGRGRAGRRRGRAQGPRARGARLRAPPLRAPAERARPHGHLHPPRARPALLEPARPGARRGRQDGAIAGRPGQARARAPGDRAPTTRPRPSSAASPARAWAWTR